MRHSSTSILLITIMILLASPAIADDECFIGIYFDDAATLRGVTAEVGETVVAHLAISPIYGTLLVTDVVQYTIFVGTPDCYVTVRNGGVNLHVPHNDADLGVEAHWEAPLLVSDVTVIADIFIPIVDLHSIRIIVDCWVLVLGPDLPANNYLSHCTRFGEMPPCNTTAATINADFIPMADEALTWGTIKSLYR